MSNLRRWLTSLAFLGCAATGAWAPAVLAQDVVESYSVGDVLDAPAAGLISPRFCGHDTCKNQPGACCSPTCVGLFGGADYLLVRPTWSEAIAFARGTQSPTSYNTSAETIDFNYDSSVRAFLGWRPMQGPSEIRFTYWNLQGAVDIGGTVGGPGQFIVDPFGGLVGTVAVINPSDARFGGPPITGGDLIETHTSVEVNVYDIQFGSAVPLGDTCWALGWDAGIRIADVQQYYDSVISSNGTVGSRGVFTADYAGAGPRLGAEIRRVGPGCAFYMNTHGALLLGEYNVASVVNPMPVFTASTDNSMTRLIPVLESEIGVHFRVTPQMLVSAGWLFQGWFDLGTSGGTFGGFYSGADDANLMSFDGLFVRGEFSF